MRPAALTVAPTQILRRFVDDLGVPHQDLRDMFRIDQRTLDKWLSGEAYPQKAARARLNELDGLYVHLRETFADMADARAWLGDPSRYLGGLTPSEVLRVGRVDRVEAALEVLDSGIFL